MSRSKWPLLFYSYTSSKKQLKWQGTNERLLSFLSSQLEVESSALQLKDNGTCAAVMKAKGMTFNFYVKALTLQIQGKENANQLITEIVNRPCHAAAILSQEI